MRETPDTESARRTAKASPQTRARRSRWPGTTEPACWVVEHYSPSLTSEVFRDAAAQLRRIARAMARDGMPIRYRHSTIVPADEVALSVIDAASLELVQMLYQRAGVRFDRIVTAEEV